MKRLWIIGCLLCAPGWTQLPDLDDFGDDLLDEPVVETPSAPESTLPPNHLFAEWQAIDSLGLPAIRIPTGQPVTIELPKGIYLVAPNVPRIADGYHRLSEFLSEQDLQAPALLKAVLHADGKFSVALLIEETPGVPLPAGIDISPLSKTVLLGMATDLQAADRRDPQVLAAFREIQSHAQKSGWKLDRREFFFLPLEPGLVFFGLESVSTPASSASNRE